SGCTAYHCRRPFSSLPLVRACRDTLVGSAVLNPNRRVWERTPWHVTRRAACGALGRDGTMMRLLSQERLGVRRTLRRPLAPVAPHQSRPGSLGGEAPREEAPAIQARPASAPWDAAARATEHHSRVPHATSGRTTNSPTRLASGKWSTVHARRVE